MTFRTTLKEDLMNFGTTKSRVHMNLHGTNNKDGSYELWNYKIAGAHELGTLNKEGSLKHWD
jgi:hypothetical protein